MPITRSTSKSRASWSGSDIRWVLFGSAALAVLGIALGAFLAREKAPEKHIPHPMELSREGSITFAGGGKLCRQVAIDNKTGRIGETKMIPCGPQDDTAKQVEAFKDGFQRKPDGRSDQKP
jgi:hypothetical protein